MKKRMIGLMMAFTMAASLIGGCAGTPSGPAGAAGSETAGKDNNGALNIAIVSSQVGIDDGSFIQNNYEGILAFLDENPDSSVTPVKTDKSGAPAAISAVTDIVADYDVIVCCGFQYSGIGTLAEENPDLKFLLVDTPPTYADGSPAECDNIYSMTFKEQEGGFCAGMAAALETRTGKVAVVNGIAYQSNVNYQWGFESGVNYANKHCGANAEVIEIASYAGTDITGANVGGNYVGSFADEATGKIVAEALIDKGVDVLFAAAGASGNGVLTAVKEAKDAYFIGCDVDQYNDGAKGSSNVVLTSTLKVMDMNIEKQLNLIKDGTFKGENALLGADTDSTGYVKEEGRQQLSEDTIKAIDEAFAKVKSGEIVPASNFNGETPEAFKGL